MTPGTKVEASVRVDGLFLAHLDAEIVVRESTSEPLAPSAKHTNWPPN